MKICLFGITEIKTGKVNLRDSRLDEAHRLVEAKKKTYAQVEAVGPEEAQTANAILASTEGKVELILKDLEFVETRLARQPSETEKLVLEKIQRRLEAQRLLFNDGLTADDWQAVAAHHFFTSKPVITATLQDLVAPDPLMWSGATKSWRVAVMTGLLVKK